MAFWTSGGRSHGGAAVSSAAVLWVTLRPRQHYHICMIWYAYSNEGYPRKRGNFARYLYQRPFRSAKVPFRAVTMCDDSVRARKVLSSTATVLVHHPFLDPSNLRVGTCGVRADDTAIVGRYVFCPEVAPVPTTSSTFRGSLSSTPFGLGCWIFRLGVT